MNYFDIYRDATNERWAGGLNDLPPHMVDAVVRYVVNGMPPGSFLTAVLSGNLFEALGRADALNKQALPDYGIFFTNYAPLDCFGSGSAVCDWIKSGGIKGQIKDAVDAAEGGN